MLDYKKLNDANASEYIKETISEIKSADERELLENLRMLQIKLHNKEIDTINATMLMGAIKKGIKERRQSFYNNHPSRFSHDESGGRTMSMNPVGGNGHTSVSNRAGAAAVIFIVVNVAITTAMYTLLLLSKLLK